MGEWHRKSGTGEVAVLDSLPKDHTFRGLWVFAVDERVAIAFAETKGTETDDSGVGSDLEVPSVRRAKEEGEEGDDEVSGHGDDGRGSKVEGRDGRNARSGERHEKRCDDGLHCLGCEKRSDEVQTRRGDLINGVSLFDVHLDRNKRTLSETPQKPPSLYKQYEEATMSKTAIPRKPVRQFSKMRYKLSMRSHEESAVCTVTPVEGESGEPSKVRPSESVRRDAMGRRNSK